MCENDLSLITGQKPIATKFKKSISNFKTRKNTKAGLKVTLRKDKMYEFIDRLVNIALPRIKDFRGLSSKGFDNFGNYTFGIKVTLRRNKMYEFIDRLVNIALPRIKDFRGLSPNGFDKFGNYTFGVKEHIIFPEVNFDKVDKIRGLDITIVIKSIKQQDSFELLKKLNFPFKSSRSN